MANRKQRTFNYLGRATIPAVAFDIRSGCTDGEVEFTIRRLDIENAADYGHDESAWYAGDVWIESWRQASTDWRRERIGTVKDVPSVCASGQRFSLPGFAADDGIVFTIKVVDPQTGRLLAFGSSASDRKSGSDDLIETVIEPTLGEVPWRICWGDDYSVWPKLLVNRALPSPTGIVAADLRAKATTTPAIVREIMHHIAMDQQARESEWAAAWLRFLGAEAEDVPEADTWADAMRWANSMVEVFCLREAWVTKLQKSDVEDVES